MLLYILFHFCLNIVHTVQQREFQRQKKPATCEEAKSVTAVFTFFIDSLNH